MTTYFNSRKLDIRRTMMLIGIGHVLETFGESVEDLVGDAVDMDTIELAAADPMLEMKLAGVTDAELKATFRALILEAFPEAVNE